MKSIRACEKRVAGTRSLLGIVVAGGGRAKAWDIAPTRGEEPEAAEWIRTCEAIRLRLRIYAITSSEAQGSRKEKRTRLGETVGGKDAE